MDILSMNAQWISSIWLIYFLIFLQDITSEFLKNNNNRWIPNWRIIGTDGYWNNLISTQQWYLPPTQQGWNEFLQKALHLILCQNYIRNQLGIWEGCPISTRAHFVFKF
jgi:hypothetical protein